MPQTAARVRGPGTAHLQGAWRGAQAGDREQTNGTVPRSLPVTLAVEQAPSPGWEGPRVQAAELGTSEGWASLAPPQLSPGQPDPDNGAAA